MKRSDMQSLADNILEKNRTCVVNCAHMEIRARPALPRYDLLLERNGHCVRLSGSELVLRQGADREGSYRLDLLDCHHYPCAVHIATLTVSFAEARKISEQLDMSIKDSSTEEPLEDIKLAEQRRLLSINNPPPSS